MGAKYWAEVSYKYERRVVVLEPCQILGGLWRIGWYKPSGSSAGWRCNTQHFVTREACQAALDAEAQNRGLKPVREV